MYDVEANQYGKSDYSPFDNTMAFSDVSIRAGFIRKVYSILLCQLVVTIAFICFFLYWTLVYHNFFSRAVTFVTMIAMACCESVRRTFPTNMIFLSLFTLCEGYLLGAVSRLLSEFHMISRIPHHIVVVLAITIFAFQTKYDFTMMGGILFVALIILICFGFLMIFFHSRVLSIVYACIGALIFAVYLVYDTQIMMGGGKMYSISPEEYIFAALNLYLDIVNLFLYILQIIAAARGD
ncbi:PREDICTED: protein lifeguard 1-like [Acropora digitifera]|uniref:protein lifeguard 1-like n=1 Tax=Acropora digitifera TaxID=70779 RepID=UPI000779FE2B|nr:PREDICTED: protein lifeguard 1-like [Acropora digitifera]